MVIYLKKIDKNTLPHGERNMSVSALSGTIYILDLLYSEAKINITEKSDEIRKVSEQAIRQLMGAS